MIDPVKAIQDWIDGLVKEVREVTPECVREAAAEILPEMELGLEFIYQQAVQKWYASYIPSFYHRNESLFNLMEIESDYTDTDGLTLEYIFNDSNMTKDRKGGSLFEHVFIHGWHGGAFDRATGTFRYRTPHPGWYVWGRTAVKTSPAYFMFEKEKKKFEETYSRKFSEIVQQKVNKRFEQL